MKKDNFYADVLAVVALIPYGKVTTYGAIAEYLGAKRSARMVGYALNQSTYSPENPLPAHRVINRSGALTGKHAFSGVSMAERLISEGILVENDCVKDLNTYFWNPNEALLHF